MFCKQIALTLTAVLSSSSSSDATAEFHCQEWLEEWGEEDPNLKLYYNTIVTVSWFQFVVLKQYVKMR